MLRRTFGTLRPLKMATTTGGKPPKNPLIFVLGATGTGKSQLAIDLALHFNGEIINADAMQMYDGLPIITNKITPLEACGIPHHLLGFIPLDSTPWYVGLFRKRALGIIDEIRSRGKIPVVVGGTHYYTQSLLFEGELVDEVNEGKDEGGGKEEEERMDVLNGSTEGMLERLKEVDPVMAERWHPKDRRKIRRSLEIYLKTGRKASEVYAEQRGKRLSAGEKESSPEEQDGDEEETENEPLLFWVHADREILKPRLNTRVEKMIQNGMLQEVESMNVFLRRQEKSGITVDRTLGIWVSIGFKEFSPYFSAISNGASENEIKKAYEEAIEMTKGATRRYAKNQIRWIRLQLIPKLKNEGFEGRLFLMDGSDISQWTEKVKNPAIEVTEKFLEGREIPKPEEVCEKAREFLDEEVEQEERVKRECELCNVVVFTEGRWEEHLKTRRHRFQVKKQLKNKDRTRRQGEETADDSFEVLPPTENEIP